MDCLRWCESVVFRTRAYATHCECCFQDQRIRDSLVVGSDVALEKRIVTVVHGTDLISVNFLNFAAHHEEAAQVRSALTLLTTRKLLRYVLL